MTRVPVHWWPARLAPATSGVFVIGVHGDGGRAAARSRIRAALCEALAQLTGLAPEDVEVASTPGSAPRVAFRRVGSPARAVPGIAITHDGNLSLAAINLDGPVGIDLMQVAETTGLEAVARDYLGPAAAASMQAMPATGRAAAFARAWTEREARLKCLGLPLAEWSPAASQAESRCRCTPLALPPGFIGMLAA